MYFEWGNGGFYAGRDYLRGPEDWHVAIMYNNRERITGRPTPEGEHRCADAFEVYWRWPSFKGVHVFHFKMPWRYLEPGKN